MSFFYDFQRTALNQAAADHGRELRGAWTWRFVDDDEWTPVDGEHNTEASALRAARRQAGADDVIVDKL
jgi:hypothetical protein